ncbi:tRNA (adenine(58)-N(1))-methyltransferase non-catalytic subunit trm6 [Lobulomyces angularis]|nr:tRNA (adenine(58)-N(1))-methyltransferase non-catalytic subunit trm6 [Lobulomyces angularis]
MEKYTEINTEKEVDTTQNSNPDIIKLNDWVILELPSNNRKLYQAKENINVNIGKFGQFNSSEIIGKYYECYYEIVDGRELKRLEQSFIAGLLAERLDETEDLNTNRNIYDDSNNQTLKYDEIEKMKVESLKGTMNSEIMVKNIIENSSTFEQKTDFAKAKYIKKKSKKFSKVVQPLKPSAQSLCEYYFEKNPAKILDFRFDTLFQLISLANLRATSGAKYLVVDDSQGLVVGAMLERTNGISHILGLHEKENHAYEILKTMNFEQKVLDSVLLLPWKNIKEEIRFEKEENSARKELDATISSQRENRRNARLNKLSAAKKFLNEGEYHSLIIATYFSVQPILQTLTQYLAGSATVAIYSNHKEHLLECYNFLRNSKEFQNVELIESFLRDYQVPVEGSSGTHPKMTVLGGGGFILSAVRVLDDPTLVLKISVKDNKRKKKATRLE